MNKAGIFLLFAVTLVSATDYSYYTFAVEWTGSVCELNNCTGLTGVAQKWFNVHGLWPSEPSNDGPFYCSNSSVFNPDNLSPETRDELKQYWSGLYSSDDSFHSHEWSKHGTCWNDDENNTLSDKEKQEAFFSTVISIAQGLDMYATLESANIIPGQNYTYDHIVKAISQAYGVPQLQCDNQYLVAVYLCLDLNYGVIDCPEAPSYCGSEVYYPTF